MPVISSAERRMIFERTRRAFGTEDLIPHTGMLPVIDRSQRELTFIIADVSGSMGAKFDRETTKMEASIQALTLFITNKAKLDPDDEIGVITFTNLARLLHPLSRLAEHKAKMITTIQSLKDGSGTDLATGLAAASSAFEWARNGVVRRIMMYTDGQGGDPVTIAETLKARGVVIDVVGVGSKPSNVNEPLLKRVASVIEGVVHYRFIKDHNTLDAHFTRLAGKTATSVH
ncbi:MAG: VWA domain-containing protein [Planctomycetes bacterium]|nr:VWA domain-containing protein [Planctomycetota bacterium]